MTEPNSEKRELDSFLRTMRDRFARDEADEAEIRAEAKEDLRFLGGKQWDERTLRERTAANRPALVFNRLPTFTAQVANEARQNKPQVSFTAAEDGDVDTADVMEGLARQIQHASKASVSYETALQYSTGCSFGHFRILTDYAGPRTFDQEIRFAPILDPFSVYGVLIPRCLGQKPKHAFVIETLSREDFKRQYPKSELVSIGFEGDVVHTAGEWIGDDIRVAEYWYSEPFERTLQELSDGRTLFRDEYDRLPEGVTVVRERIEYEDRFKWCKTNGIEVLEETDWVGNCIPIFTALGQQLIVDGRPELYSLIRFMRDPQKLINVYKSGIAEQIGMSSRAPYVGYKGQFKSPAWRDANVKNYAYLEAEPVTIGGQPAPLPQRQVFESPIQALSVAAAQEIDDQKAIAGIFDASLGNVGNETSGIAIQRRQQQSGLTNLHFIDNLTRAQEEAGDALGYMIPRVYDAKRTIKILGENEKERVVTVNAVGIDPDTGKPTRFFLNAGKYDVKVSIGPGYTTKRQEAADQTARVIQSAPQLMGVIGDIFFRNTDTAGAEELAERLKKWIGLQAPGLVEEDKQPEQIPPQLQAQLQAMSQELNAAAGTIDQLKRERELNQIQAESKERIEMAKLQLERERLQAEILLKHEEMGSREAIVQLQAQLELIREQIARTEAMLESAQPTMGPVMEPQSGGTPGMEPGSEPPEMMS